jgi:hypothetical protein
MYQSVGRYAASPDPMPLLSNLSLMRANHNIPHGKRGRPCVPQTRGSFSTAFCINSILPFSKVVAAFIFDTVHQGLISNLRKSLVSILTY